MRNRNLILLLSMFVATFLVFGCSPRQFTKGETDQFNAISGKIAQAENMKPKGAKECAPKELAVSKATLDGARHEATESWETAAPYITNADKAADTVLAKTKACQPPVVKFSADPASIAAGKCSTLKWSSENVKDAEIDQDIGKVAATGSKEVCPGSTTQYMLSASGTGGTVYEAATVTVEAPPPPPPAAKPPVVPVVAPKAPEVTLRVNFDTNKYNIRPADLAELQKAADFMKNNPKAKIRLVGYTDSRGSAKHNQKLSENRAGSVKKYLEGEVTIAPENIASEGKGAADPVGDNKTKEGQFQNRRVELWIK